MALLKGRADRSIGVADLMRPVQAFSEEMQDRNLLKLLSPTSGLTWKSAPCPEWLAKLGPLFKNYCSVSPNSVIPPKKHRQALTRLHEASRQNFTKKADSDFIDYIDEVLRIAMAQLRVLKQSPVAKERAYKKATACEKETLDDMLSGLALTKEEGEENAPDEETAPTLTLAVWQPSAQGRAEQPGSSSQKVPLSPSTVFGRVLAKKDSLESEDGRSETKAHNPTAKPGFMSGLMNLSTLDQEDAHLLQDCKNTKPINHSGKSQLQRLKLLGVGKKKKAKAKAKSKAKAKAIPAILKRPSSNRVSEDMFEVEMDAENPRRHRGSQRLPDAGCPRRTRKKRYQSRAYHKARNQAIKQGLSNMVAKQKGTEAMRRATQQFDLLNPNP